MQVACTALGINASSGNTGPLRWEVSKNSRPKKEVCIEEGLICFYSPWRRNSSAEAVNDGLDWKAAVGAKAQTCRYSKPSLQMPSHIAEFSAGSIHSRMAGYVNILHVCPH